MPINGVDELRDERLTWGQRLWMHVRIMGWTLLVFLLLTLGTSDENPFLSTPWRALFAAGKGLIVIGALHLYARKVYGR